VRRPSAEILRSIAEALAIRTETLYERAGLLDGYEAPGISAAISTDTKLTIGQKQALMEIYTSFISNDLEDS
jgi:hypothetical protein